MIHFLHPSPTFSPSPARRHQRYNDGFCDPPSQPHSAGCPDGMLAPCPPVTSFSEPSTAAVAKNFACLLHPFCGALPLCHFLIKEHPFPVFLLCIPSDCTWYLSLISCPPFPGGSCVAHKSMSPARLSSPQHQDDFSAKTRGSRAFSDHPDIRARFLFVY